MRVESIYKNNLAKKKIWQSSRSTNGHLLSNPTTATSIFYFFFALPEILKKQFTAKTTSFWPTK